MSYRRGVGLQFRRAVIFDLMSDVTRFETILHIVDRACFRGEVSAHSGRKVEQKQRREEERRIEHHSSVTIECLRHSTV